MKFRFDIWPTVVVALITALITSFIFVFFQKPLEKMVWDERRSELSVSLAPVVGQDLGSFNFYGKCPKKILDERPLMLNITAIHGPSAGFGVFLKRAPACLGVNKNVQVYNPEGYLEEFQVGDSMLVPGLAKDQSAELIFLGVSPSDFMQVQSDEGTYDIK